MFNDSESAESWLARAALPKEKHSNGNGAGMPLAVAVKIADWPTPRASENENRQTKASPSQLAGEHGWSLGAAVNHQWPTPTTTEGKGPTRGANAQGGMGLSQTVRAVWPTPTVCGNDNRKGASLTSGDGLGTAVRELGSTWSTPTVNAAQNATAAPSQYERNSGRLPVETGSSVAAPLSPAWVCRLMGFPDGWTITSGPPAVAKRSTPASLRARRRASQ
jgi:site-specific DNA-cytosine methylase